MKMKDFVKGRQYDEPEKEAIRLRDDAIVSAVCFVLSFVGAVAFVVWSHA
jgi:hypothetical protein